jgi:SURF4 family
MKIARCQYDKLKGKVSDNANLLKRIDEYNYCKFSTFSLALIFHPYWTVSDPAEARTQASSFFGHLSMMGGMLFVVAFGAGAYSVDALITQPSTGEIAARRLREFGR